MKIKISKVLTTLAITVLIILEACNPAKKWEKEERQEIQDYFNSIGDTVFTKMASGLYYLEIEEGTGRQPVEGDTVGMMYTGRFLDGRIFDSNKGDSSPFGFIVGSKYVIQGLEEGVTYMKKGGKAKFVTPSFLAYGTSGIYGVISGYTPLLWDIELVEVLAGSKK